MQQIAITRILSDINDLMKNPLDKDGIYWHLNEDNIFNFKALIIGPQGTPYEGGFYFFDFVIPNTYPFDPPKATYCTQYENIRFNPNLYTNGKVCLSILNTWSGPAWTPSNTLSSILVSLLGLVFVEYPLKNEPGKENCSKFMIEEYNDIIEYSSFKGAIIMMLNNIANGFEMFKDIIETHFKENIVYYLEKSRSLLKTKNNITRLSGLYNISIKTNYNLVTKEIEDLYEKLTGNKILPIIENINMKTLKEICKNEGIDIRKKLKKDLYNELYTKLYKQKNI